MLRPDFHFRQAQCAFDLIRCLQSTNDAQLTHLGGEAVIDVVRNASCRFERESEAQCYETIALAALDATEGADIAVALLIANKLQRGLWRGEVREFAEMAIERVRASPSTLRSAILRGLDELDALRYSYEPIGPYLPNESRLTRPMSGIVPKLCDIARRMDTLTCKSVAAADYGMNVAEHFEALQETLAAENCRFSERKFSIPNEVVHLVAYVPRTLGFIPCTALLLANALPTKDAGDWFSFRWGTLAKDYNSLPESVRGPFLDGIRYLFEAETE